MPKKCDHTFLKGKVQQQDFSDLEMCSANHHVYIVGRYEISCLRCPECEQYISAKTWSKWMDDDMGAKRKLNKSIQKSDAVLFLPAPTAVDKQAIETIGSLLDRDVVVCSRPEIHAEVIKAIQLDKEQQ